MALLHSGPLGTACRDSRISAFHAAQAGQPASWWHSSLAKEDNLQSPIVLFPAGKDRPRLGVLLFIIAWLLGNVALIGLTNQGEEMVFTCAFAIACGLWWGGFKLGSLSTAVGTAVGFIVLVIWTLGLLSALALSFQSFA